MGNCRGGSRAFVIAVNDKFLKVEMYQVSDRQLVRTATEMLRLYLGSIVKSSFRGLDL